jgi:hypothetical protein
MILKLTFNNSPALPLSAGVKIIYIGKVYCSNMGIICQAIAKVICRILLKQDVNALC